jgi:hypothetical protein
VADLSICLNNFQALRLANKLQTVEFVELLFENWDRAGEFCQAVADGDVDKIESFFNDLKNLSLDESSNPTRRAESIGLDPYSQPTAEDFVVTNPDYEALMRDSTPQWLVTVQDEYNGSLDDDKFMKKVISFNEDYPGAGTGIPGTFVHE